MLTLLGGGGKKGNQFVQIGGTFNSLMGTLTPMLVGGLIGSVTKSTVIADVNPVLFIAMGVFVVAFIILGFIPITDPQLQSEHVVFESSPCYKEEQTWMKLQNWLSIGMQPQQRQHRFEWYWGIFRL